ncbi:MAG: LuxR C-terminal-related transcriptional regulator [Kiritimatiellae bacterium]|nr:LuxR C-terminal-related transcriptional regulator [Kiritimatiellia bacterium]
MENLRSRISSVGKIENQRSQGDRGESVIDDDIRRSAETYRSAPRLNSRQIEILDYASRGLENAEIAKLLGITSDGMKKHLKLIYAALGASTRAEASALALRLGLIG